MKNRLWWMRPLVLSLTVAAFAAMALEGGSEQVPSNQQSLKAMVARSELSFLGRVEIIEYRLSEPSGPEGVRIPYTFVTYRIERAFLGAPLGNSVTLRFMGGFDPRKLRYMATSVTPQFDVGDHDILFVEGNTQRLCPLVGSLSGRLRVIDGQVYTEMGQAVKLEKDGSLRLGGTYRLEAVLTTTVNGRTLTTTAMGPSARPLPSDAVAAEALIAAVADLARRATPARAFINADPNRPFAGPDMTPAPPPAERTQK